VIERDGCLRIQLGKPDIHMRGAGRGRREGEG
jgi:hypothetical protein